MLSIIDLKKGCFCTKFIISTFSDISLSYESAVVSSLDTLLEQMANQECKQLFSLESMLLEVEDLWSSKTDTDSEFRISKEVENAVLGEIQILKATFVKNKIK